MKLLRYILIACLSLVAITGNAQMIKDNSVWTFEAKKVTGNQYEIIAHLKLEKGWHIYSMVPGGDGTLIPPSITFDKNGSVNMVGKVMEKGTLISENLAGIEGKVNMYSGKVDYTQRALIKGKTTLTGTYTYQICNDRMCLPPTTKKYKIVMK